MGRAVFKPGNNQGCFSHPVAGEMFPSATGLKVAVNLIQRLGTYGLSSGKLPPSCSGQDCQLFWLNLAYTQAKFGPAGVAYSGIACSQWKGFVENPLATV